MECTECQQDLLELLYEELGDLRAQEVRAHLADCVHCQEVWEGMRAVRSAAAQMPELDGPRPHVHAAIMQAAREALPVAGELEESRLAAWWLSFRQLVMAPQFAMVTVMLLVVAVGLWAIPREPEPWEVLGDGASDAEFELPTSPAPAAGKIAEAAEPEEAFEEEIAEVEAESVAEPAPQPVSRRARARRSSGRPVVAIAARDEEDAEGASFDRGDADEGAGAPDDFAELGDVRGAGGGVELGGNIGRSGSLAQEPAVRVGSERRHREAIASQAAPAAEVHRGAADRAVAMGAPETSESSMQAYARGLRHYRSGDYRTAARTFEPLIGPESEVAPHALLYLARSHHALADYSRASDRYRLFLQRYPNRSETPKAMLELAETYRRAGRSAQARRWLERAAKYESVEDQARNALEALTE